MKNKNIINFFRNYIKSYGRIIGGFLVFSAALVFNSCVDFEEPSAIYDSSYAKTNDPAITGVVPAAIALGGVREIRINGENLGVKGSDTDWVYVGGVRATIKEIIGSQTIVIYRPQLSEGNYGSPIQINVTAPKAIDTSANISYTVESPGGFLGTYSLITAAINGIDFDKNENIYVVSNRTVYRNDPSGNTLTSLLTSLPGAFRSISDVKFGPGESGLDLYLVNGTNIVSRVRVDTVATGLKPIAVDTLPLPVIKMDFNENGSLYAGGTGGIFLVNGNNQSLGYAGLNIKTIRVFNGYIYVADSLNIWKSQILSDGSLGQQELLGGLNNVPGFPAGCFITSMAVDENANIYLSIRNHPRYSIFALESTTSITPFYLDEDILPRTSDQLVWGNGRYLYLVSASLTSGANRIFRMAFDKNGAPYQGRKFLKDEN